MGTGRTNTDGVVLDLYDASGTLLGTVTPEIDVAAAGEGDAAGSAFSVFAAGFEQEGVARIDLVRSGVVLGSTVANRRPRWSGSPNPSVVRALPGIKCTLHGRRATPTGTPLSSG